MAQIHSMEIELGLERRRSHASAFPDLSALVFVSLGTLLAVLVLLPMFWLGYSSLLDTHDHFTLANFAALVTDPSLRQPMILSSAIALLVGFFSCAVGAPLAWLVARTDMPCRRLVRMLVTASFVTPPFLGAIAWEILAAPNSGILNQVYRDLFGLDSADYLIDIYSVCGLVFCITCNALPYVFVLMTNTLDRITVDLEDACAVLGGGTWQTLRRVTFPLILPAVLAGALVAILQTLTLFGSPAILALPAGFHVITTKIWSLFEYPPKLGLGTQAALPLLVVTVFLPEEKN
jgi:iron(III) transport system permease protein